MINHLAFCITKDNVDDRQLEQLFKNLSGLAAGDKGYLSKKKEESLFQKGVKLITKVRRNMKDKMLSPFEKYFLGLSSSGFTPRINRGTSRDQFLTEPSVGNLPAYYRLICRCNA
ncbi:hypothetical protein FOG18_05840 [Legionella israelensis]|nr:hypothetical protein FOG18_05840 [Legionella israelensis]